MSPRERRQGPFIPHTFGRCKCGCPDSEKHNAYWVPADTPYHENLEQYLALKEEAFRDVYARPVPLVKTHITYAKYLDRDMCIGAVYDRAEDGDAEALVEIAVRLATGCGINVDHQSLESAIEHIDHLISPEKSPFDTFPMAPSEDVLRRALSVSASLHSWRYHCSKRAGTLHGFRIDADLYRAAAHANAAVDRGLRCMGAIRIAEDLLCLGKLHRQPVRGADRFGKFQAMWAAYDEYLRVQEKRAGASRRYMCAAEHCGVRAMKRSHLKQCAGGCSPESKPIYCSKEGLG
ncbi:hypothetical protein C8Q80DRAFT_1125465 [Daedaleopsis nitida]|nr:hypothetical protein C8Q80DRAFT_1125606 [Daedaleopsis nitida]KAI0737318.1 hypothetical protein C8Q80DRAFT_1125465 [Daedaleopsis nitida]